jgi:hypothetical protein
MLVARNKKTGEFLNDFQSYATPQVLIQNAVRAGLKIDEIEIVKVTEEDFKQIKTDYIAAHPPEPNPIEEKLNADRASALQKLKALGLTEDEVKALLE